MTGEHLRSGGLAGWPGQPADQPRHAARLLADELFCVAHDDRTGRPRLADRVLGLGLAAALLGELVLSEQIYIDAAGVHVIAGQPPADAVDRAILGHLINQSHYRDVRTWLAFLAPNAAGAVADRLARAGLWRWEKHRRWWGRNRPVFVPLKATDAAWCTVRLERVLTGPQPISPADAVLGGLVVVTNLTGHVLWQTASHETGIARTRAEVQRLDVPLRHLLAATETAVGDAVLAPH